MKCPKYEPKRMVRPCANSLCAHDNRDFTAGYMGAVVQLKLKGRLEDFCFRCAWVLDKAAVLKVLDSVTSVRRRELEGTSEYSGGYITPEEEAAARRELEQKRATSASFAPDPGIPDSEETPVSDAGSSEQSTPAKLVSQTPAALRMRRLRLKRKLKRIANAEMPRKPGRPRKSNPMTSTERWRAWRDRKKAAKKAAERAAFDAKYKNLSEEQKVEVRRQVQLDEHIRNADRRLKELPKSRKRRKGQGEWFKRHLQKYVRNWRNDPDA